MKRPSGITLLVLLLFWLAIGAFVYRARVQADVSAAELAALLAETDRVAEIQNTVRQGCSVSLELSS